MSELYDRPKTGPGSTINFKNIPPYKEGDEYHIKCMEHFVPGEHTFSRVVSRGGRLVWEPEELHCRYIPCDKPKTLQFGRTVPENVDFAESFRYECDEGYALNSSRNHFTCGTDRKWQPYTNSYFCQPIWCKPVELKPPENGVIVGEPGDGWYMSTYTFACNPGFTMVQGDPVRTCQSNGQWSGLDVKCEQVVPCMPLGAPDHGSFRILQGDGTSLGSEVLFECKNGYWEVGDTLKRTCQANGQWSGRDVTCVPVECEPLTNPLNGSYNFSRGRYYRSEATLQCKRGYQPRGPSKRVCGADGLWNGREATCEPVVCGDLENPQYGRFHFSNGHSFESRATLYCDRGFEVAGGSNVKTCEKTGLWSGEQQLACVPKVCEPLIDPENGKFELSRGNGSYNSQVTLKCDIGYEVVGGSALKTCLENGSWTPGDLRCEPIKCQPLIDPENGRFRLANISFNSQATLECNEGYEVKGGSATKTCEATGLWSGSKLTCERIKCKLPINPRNGSFHFTGTSFGSQATLHCEEGYRVKGTQNVKTCLADGSWTPGNVSCEPIKCKPLIDPENGRFRLSSGNAYQSRATLECDEGYEVMGGTATKTCGATGFWSGRGNLNCVPVECPELPKPQNGSFHFTGGNVYKSQATLLCDEGYEIRGKPTPKICGADRKWRGGNAKCEPIKCEPLPKPLNGSFHFTRGNVYMSQATLHCDEGFTQKGNRGPKTCQADGKWSGGNTNCEPIQCDALPILRNGSFQFTNGLDYKSQATLHCNKGYRVEGDSSPKTCRADGTWSGGPATCEPLKCEALINPQNGFFQFAKGTDSFESQAILKCNEGYRMVGTPATMKCLDTGLWSGGGTARCEPIKCPKLPSVSHGKFFITDGVGFFESQATLTCDRGYEVVGGPAMRTCLATGQWSQSDAECKPVACEVLSNPENGSFHFVKGNGFFFESEVAFQCDAGYRIVGGLTRVCGADGKWSGRDVVCELVECSELRDPPNGMVKVGGRGIRSEAAFKCKRGYRIVQGDPVRVCQADGLWSGEEVTCGLVECSEPINPENGRVSFKDHFFKSVAVFACDPGYGLVGGQARRTCQADGSWSGSSVACERVCSQLLDPPNGKVWITSWSIGSEATFECHPGYRMVRGQPRRFCQADGQWSGEDVACDVDPTVVEPVVSVSIPENQLRGFDEVEPENPILFGKVSPTGGMNPSVDGSSTTDNTNLSVNGSIVTKPDGGSSTTNTNPSVNGSIVTKPDGGSSTSNTNPSVDGSTNTKLDGGSIPTNNMNPTVDGSSTTKLVGSSIPTDNTNLSVDGSSTTKTVGGSIPINNTNPTVDGSTNTNLGVDGSTTTNNTNLSVDGSSTTKPDGGSIPTDTNPIDGSTPTHPVDASLNSFTNKPGVFNSITTKSKMQSNFAVIWFLLAVVFIMLIWIMFKNNSKVINIDIKV